jgi:hypothetical protein
MTIRALAPYLRKFCAVYLDDVLIYNYTADDHFEHIQVVLRELQRNQLHVKLSNCYFGLSSVNFLGHVVEARHIRMDPNKVEAVHNWPRPKSVTEVRGFLGLAGCYRRFIHQFATLATPLMDLAKKTPEFRLTPQAESAFEHIKDAMVRAPVLIIPETSPNARYTMYTDASGFAV